MTPWQEHRTWACRNRVKIKDLDEQSLYSPIFNKVISQVVLGTCHEIKQELANHSPWARSLTTPHSHFTDEQSHTEKQLAEGHMGDRQQLGRAGPLNYRKTFCSMRGVGGLEYDTTFLRVSHWPLYEVFHI